jgi:hypothetical protein
VLNEHFTHQCRHAQKYFPSIVCNVHVPTRSSPFSIFVPLLLHCAWLHVAVPVLACSTRQRGGSSLSKADVAEVVAVVELAILQ